ncbi:hypothetical protein PQR62_04425 [Herbaspirillum lusitanum]|uniref:Uncharacterized protein n=1 Tax=Herbaspirillum lusitanum TaxID=213312 RepID=A0ABW9A4A5_9BURK
MMVFTTLAPWRRQQLSERGMRQAILDHVADKVCWRIGKYLGSMLYMDFGGEVQITNVRKGLIRQGEAMLGIRDCFWSLSSEAQVIVDSESISDENASEKLSCIEGAYLRDFAVHESVAVDFIFSSNVVLSLNTTNRYATDDDIAEFVAPDGRIYIIRPDGILFLSDEVSKIRFVR